MEPFPFVPGEIPRFASGFRLAARTPRKRLNINNGHQERSWWPVPFAAHSRIVIPTEASACFFDPQSFRVGGRVVEGPAVSPCRIEIVPSLSLPETFSLYQQRAIIKSSRV